MGEASEGNYPNRRWVVPLGMTVMVGFGVILYGFSVYTTDLGAGGEFSTTALSLAYGGSVFVGGLLALPVGAFADKHGVRGIVGAGALLGCLGLVGFSMASQTWQVIAAWWAFLGPAQAMIYYEPAYVAIEQWSPTPRDRSRSLATITLVGGLAGIIFIPAATQLVTLLGWRMAVAVLGLLLLVAGGLTSLLALPARRPHRTAVGSSRSPDAPMRGLLADRRFIVYTVALILILLSTQGVIAHRLARFEQTGFALTTVSLWAAAASAMSLPGRWVAPRLAERFGAARVQAITALIVASSVLLMVDGATPWQMIGHFSLFGLAFGALLPLRAMVMGGWYSGPSYGKIMGTQWTAVVLVGATGPVLVGTMRDAGDDYATAFLVVTGLFLLSAMTIAATGRSRIS